MTDPRNPLILSAGTALPPHYATQEAIIAAFQEAWNDTHYNADRLQQLHRAVGVKGRHLALPLDAYRSAGSFARRNEAWIAAALDVGAEALRHALAAAGLVPADLDHLVMVTTTGIATPSLDARLVNRLDLRRDVLRTPIFGLGCAGGAAGLARAADYLRAYPDRVAALVSVEICSLTLQRDDLSVANMVASGLFGDGAAAVVLAGSRRGAALAEAGTPRSTPRIRASATAFYPDTERVMGWDILDSGFKVVLSAQVPEVIRTHIRGDVEAFLADCGLGLGDIDHWIVHTGGPRVLEAVTAALELPPDALALSWRSLSDVGNVSSASVLFVLAEHLANGAARPGERGLLAAMGPGFASEMLLVEW